jgi:hypothetical protein
MGVVVGWHGPLAIVSLDAGGYVEVQDGPASRARAWDNQGAEYSGSRTITHNARRPRSGCTPDSGALAIRSTDG